MKDEYIISLHIMGHTKLFCCPGENVIFRQFSRMKYFQVLLT